MSRRVVARLACVDAPAFALQLLTRRRVEWRGLPAAVIDRDAPHGVILWANQAARDSGVLPGLRYAAALALCEGLRASEVELSEISQGIEEVCELLRRHSPHVEPSEEEPGVFWVDVSGLGVWIESQPRTSENEDESERAVPRGAAAKRTTKASARAGRSAGSSRRTPPADAARSSTPAQSSEGSPLLHWARATRATLAAHSLECAIVVGFNHFGVYAVAKALRGGRVFVFDSEAEEDAFARRVPLRRLGIDPKARVELEKLAVWRVEDLLGLPQGGIRVRYGDSLARLHALASKSEVCELEPRAAPDPPTRALDLDTPTSDLELLLALTEELTLPLLRQLERRGQAAAEIRLTFELEDLARVEERVEPAEPTLDFDALVRLLRLRLERQRFQRGVQRLAVTLRGAVVSKTTPSLFASTTGRDPASAAKAFAALRAAFGDDVVVRARLEFTHLPEASFTWQAVDRVKPAQPREVLAPVLVRRIQTRSTPLPARSRHEQDGWLLRGVTHGPVLRLHGPFHLCGGWWRSEVVRDYHYAELQSGALLWIYFDRVRRRWFLQGSVS